MSAQPKQSELFAGVQAIAEDLAGEFRHQRISRHWTQRDAAELMGCTESAVSSLESVLYLSGQKSGFPSMDLVRRACGAYGISDARMIERFRHLRALTGKTGEMRNKAGVGKRIAHKERAIRGAGLRMVEKTRHVDEFDFPEFERPGVDPQAVVAFGVWAVVICVSAWCFMRWGFFFFNGK